MARILHPARTTAYTLEEFDFGADCLGVELSIAYTLEPYDPGYRYNRNGDGLPPSGGGVEDFTVKVTSAQGEFTDYAGADLAAIEAAVNMRLDADEDLCEALRQRCEQAEEAFALAKEDARFEALLDEALEV